MKLFITLLSASLVALAVGGQMSAPLHIQEEGLQRHLVRKAGTAHSLTGPAGNRMMRKRSSSNKCKSKTKSHKKAETSSGSTTSGDDSSSTNKGTNNDSSSSNTSKGSSGSSKDGDNEKSSNSSSSSLSSSSSTGKGLAGMTFSGNCKKPNASTMYPNGDLSFLNCGVSKSSPNSKWTPPMVKMSDVKTVSAATAASSSAFKACSKYQSDFEKAEQATGVPAVMIMSFAMQESTCNPNTIGGNGEIGMLQLTPDKCTNANCKDAATNILMGAKYFKSQIDQYKGNVVEAVGAYNGWSSSMTYSSATNQQYGCHSQNNLDYLNQFFNGWCQGKDGYTKAYTTYNNLAACPN